MSEVSDKLAEILDTSTLNALKEKMDDKGDIAYRLIYKGMDQQVWDSEGGLATIKKFRAALDDWDAAAKEFRNEAKRLFNQTDSILH